MNHKAMLTAILALALIIAEAFAGAAPTRANTPRVRHSWTILSICRS